jgi:diguanylate cyclase
MKQKEFRMIRSALLMRWMMGTLRSLPSLVVKSAGEKCTLNITREYMVKFIGLKMLRSKKDRAHARFFLLRKGRKEIMFREFIANGALIVAGLFLNGHLFKHYPIDSATSIKEKTMVGVCLGSVGVGLMLFSFHISPTTIADLRHIPVIIAALYGGALPSISSALIVIAGRLFLFPFSQASIVASLGMLIVGVGCGEFYKMKYSLKTKFWIMNIFSLLILSIALFINVDNKSIYLKEIILCYWTISVAAGFASLYVITYINRYNQMVQTLKEQAMTDFLTGLHNVRQFDQLFYHYVNDAKKHSKHLSLLLIDIDFFKNINDTYGHLEGDRILKEVGEILYRTSRSIDIVSRNGGEEFSILLPNCSYSHALEVAERIRLGIEQHTFILSNGMKIPVTVSIGVATYPDTESDDLYYHADQKLYQAKEKGRNRVC